MPQSADLQAAQTYQQKKAPQANVSPSACHYQELRRNRRDAPAAPLPRAPAFAEPRSAMINTS